jgi:acyl-CoA hydrolase
MQDPDYYQDIDTCVDETIARVGRRIVLGIPLGIGKPNPLVNAFFRRARQNPDLHLTIMTALSLEKPKGSSELERRFLGPFVERVFGDYPDLDYAVALRRGDLPANVKVVEFYFKPGASVNLPSSQQNYISSNYTRVYRDFLDHGVNVLAQMVSRRTIDGETVLSLSSNPDVTLDLLAAVRRLKARGSEIVTIAQVNNQLPFMHRDAIVAASDFDMVVDNPAYEFKLFGAPNMSVDMTDYLIGIHVSTLLRDGGTLQIGIGSLGDAIVYGCRLRHTRNERYRALISDLGILDNYAELIERTGGLDVFGQGLYGASEMFVNGFLHLYNDGILKRRVYDDTTIQRLLNTGKIGEEITPDTIESLLEEGAISAYLTRRDFDFLQKFGVFKANLSFQDGYIEIPGNGRLAANLTDKDIFKEICQYCLGDKLRNGIVMHGGFFMGPHSLYEGLRNLSEEDNKKICMTSVSRVNQLYGNEALGILQRRHARFINTTMMVTLTGAAVSDGLENGQVISGVGGQYNFVAMADALPGARSILMLRSTRQKGGKVSSNIVWNYGHITIPRHLRDIVVTEYGIADLRGKSDQEIIAALLTVTDSRFQEGLLAEAKKAGKIPLDHDIPPQFRRNTPERLHVRVKDLREKGFFPDFPFGTDFTHEEIVLGKVLKKLKTKLAGTGGLIGALVKTLGSGPIPEQALPYLARLKLDRPTTAKEKIIQRLIAAELVAGDYIQPPASIDDQLIQHL